MGSEKLFIRIKIKERWWNRLKSSDYKSNFKSFDGK